MARRRAAGLAPVRSARGRPGATTTSSLAARIDGLPRGRGPTTCCTRSAGCTRPTTRASRSCPTAELPWYRLGWDRVRRRARRGTFDEHAAAGRGAPRPDPRRRAAVLHRRRAARRDRLVLAADEPGPRDPRGAGRGRRPGDRPARRQPAASTTSPSGSSRPSCWRSGGPEHEQRRHKLLSRYRAHGLLGTPAGPAESGSAPAAGRRPSAPPPRELSPSCRAGLVPVVGRGRRGRRASSWPRSSPMLEAASRGRGGPARSREPGVAFLAPLDPLVWDRGLLRELCDFDYIWEVYVPAAKRRWGYYVLPILFGDRLVGRIEPRIERKAGTLRVVGLWWEDGFDPLAEPGFVDGVRRRAARPRGVPRREPPGVADRGAPPPAQGGDRRRSRGDCWGLRGAAGRRRPRPEGQVSTVEVATARSRPSGTASRPSCRSCRGLVPGTGTTHP